MGGIVGLVGGKVMLLACQEKQNSFSLKIACSLRLPSHVL
jgi:hypothetical protein